jgi:hypothetical protein
MKRTIGIFMVAVFSLMLSAQVFGQLQQRDIAVVGHNLNNTGVLAVPAPNSAFNGWTGTTASYTLITSTPPQSWLKNKLTGLTQTGCTANLNIVDAPSSVDYLSLGRADVVFGGQGSFSVVCGATNLTGRFSRAVLHVANGSNSASITLFSNAVSYLVPTNLITNLAGNFAFTGGSLSIGIITEDPVVVNQVNNTISGFKAYSNVTFGARKL